MSKMSKQAWGMGTAQPRLALRTQWTVSWCRPWTQFARVGRASVGVPNWWWTDGMMFSGCSFPVVNRMCFVLGRVAGIRAKKMKHGFVACWGLVGWWCFSGFVHPFHPNQNGDYFFAGEHGSMVWNSIGRLWEVQPFQRNIRKHGCFFQILFVTQWLLGGLGF